MGKKALVFPEYGIVDECYAVQCWCVSARSKDSLTAEIGFKLCGGIAVQGLAVECETGRPGDWPDI